MADAGAAVVGIGQTEFSRGSGRSEWVLANEAIGRALDDAGLEARDVDGLVRYSYDTTDEAMVVRSFGLEIGYYGQIGYGGLGAPAVLAHAAAAIAGGLAKVVVCYRSLNGYSKTRYGRAERSFADHDRVMASGDRAPSGAFAGPYGLLAPGQVMAMWARRYASDYGLSDDDLHVTLATIAVSQRAYATRNPDAIMRTPLSFDEYAAGRMIADPLRIYDHALESDGAVAVVVASAEIARRTPATPVWIRGAVHGLVPYAESIAVYGELRQGPSYRALADRMYRHAGIAPAEISAAMLYDATSISVVLAYEAYQLADVGEGWRAIAAGGIGLDSPMPVNMNGGHLSEAYVHGMNHVTEAVRQCRGTAVNQVAQVRNVLCASGPSAVVLTP
jgi:acetyl-CoA acetyltransferase